MAPDDWRKTLERERADKDHQFAHHPRSPVPEDRREGFHGLAYYPIDEAYRLQVEIERVEPEQIAVPRTGGDQVTYTRWGRFTLELPEGEVTLTGYRTPSHPEDELFVPFKDGTAPDETYGGGRYLEVHRLRDAVYTVDLNQAYHPLCVYDDRYTCPIPPRENRTDVPVRAGERLPEGWEPAH